MESTSPIVEGKYEILSKIREGGMGTIYLARHRLLGELRVIKVMRPHMADREVDRKRFLREAQTATRLKHPNIATLHDFSVEEDGSLFMVLEFIDGITFRDLVRSCGVPPVPLAVELARQSLSALSALHRAQVVHRDISPDNLMLTSDETGAPQVKLIDLGIARQVGDSDAVTMDGAFIGKLQYCSPEQLRAGASGVDTRSDLFSLGLVLAELLTGQKIFSGGEPAVLVAARMQPVPLDFEERDPSGRIGAPLREVLARAVALEPDRRFATAEEFSAALLAAAPVRNLALSGESVRYLEAARSARASLPFKPPGGSAEQLLVDARFEVGRASAPLPPVPAGRTAPPPLPTGPTVAMTPEREAPSPPGPPSPTARPAPAPSAPAGRAGPAARPGVAMTIALLVALAALVGVGLWRLRPGPSPASGPAPSPLAAEPPSSLPAGPAAEAPAPRPTAPPPAPAPPTATVPAELPAGEAASQPRQGVPSRSGAPPRPEPRTPERRPVPAEAPPAGAGVPSAEPAPAPLPGPLCLVQPGTTYGQQVVKEVPTGFAPGTAAQFRAPRPDAARVRIVFRTEPAALREDQPFRLEARLENRGDMEVEIGRIEESSPSSPTGFQPWTGAKLPQVVDVGGSFPVFRWDGVVKAGRTFFHDVRVVDPAGDTWTTSVRIASCP